MDVQFGKRLVHALNRQGVTQSDAAKWLGVSPQMLNKYCQGQKISLESAVMLATYLSVSLDWLVGIGETESLTPRDAAALAVIRALLDDGPEAVAAKLVPHSPGYFELIGSAKLE